MSVGMADSGPEAAKTTGISAKDTAETGTNTTEVPYSERGRNEAAFAFYRDVLGSPRYVMGPMVDQSEHAWRLLGRRYGCELCYSPMYHARLFHQDHKYRDELFSTDNTDRPLIVQFCANEPEHLLSAARLVEGVCDAVDINLGCPQGIARRGHYGSFLQDEWELVSSLVSVLHRNLSIPVTCKIRIFPDVRKTIAYAKMLVDSGCQLLTVHGRIREMKGMYTGIADWQQIRYVKEAVNIPVIANGNMCYQQDVERVLRATGCDGAMAAEGQLYNPAIFAGRYPASWKIALEYLDIIAENPGSAHFGAIKGHLFKILHKILTLIPELRQRLGKAHSMEEYRAIVMKVKENVLENFSKDEEYFPTDEEKKVASSYDLQREDYEKCQETIKGGDQTVEKYVPINIPPWAIQPYFRDSYLGDESKYIYDQSFLANLKGGGDKAESACCAEKQDDGNIETVDPKVVTSAESGMSKKLAKKMAKKLEKAKTKAAEQGIDISTLDQPPSKRVRRLVCVDCKCSVASERCDYTHCRDCCKKRFDTKWKQQLAEKVDSFQKEIDEFNAHNEVPEQKYSKRVLHGVGIDYSMPLEEQGICIEHNKFLLPRGFKRVPSQNAAA